MQVRAREPKAGVSVSPLMKQPGSASVAGSGRWRVPAIAAAAAAVALAMLAVTILVRETPAARVAHPATVASAGVSVSARTRDPAHAPLGWVDGLAGGSILPSDVTSRLEAQDPRMARVVMSAWSDLNSAGGAIRLQRALGWVDGLAGGSILPSDVTSRLEAQDPRIAKVVVSAWSDLNSAPTTRSTTAVR
jgi:hypothetical protein